MTYWQKEQANLAIDRITNKGRIVGVGGFFEVGYVFAPYVPMQTTPSISIDEISNSGSLNDTLAKRYC